MLLLILTALSLLSLLNTLRIVLSSQKMRELEEVAAKARAAAITAQARAEAINNIGGRVEQEIDEMYKTLERAEAIRIDLSAFVEHGDKVVEKLDKLIRGMGGRNGG